MSADATTLVTHFAFLLGGYVLGALSVLLGRTMERSLSSSSDRYERVEREGEGHFAVRKKKVEIDDRTFVTSLDDSLEPIGAELGTVVSQEDNLEAARSKLAQLKKRS